MAVAFGSVVSVSPTTGTGATTPSITTPASNPVVMVAIGVASQTVTVSSVVGDTFGGTATEIKTARAQDSAWAYMSVWAIKAPTANTAGTVTFTLSASAPYQCAVCTYSGADQTDPCPTEDAVSSTTEGDETLTPANLNSNNGDATFGGNANAESQNTDEVIPNNRFRDNTTNVNLAVGDATGTTGITVGGTDPVDASAKIAVRIKQASAAATFPVELSRAVSAVRSEFQVYGTTFSGNMPAPVSGVPVGVQIFVLP